MYKNSNNIVKDSTVSTPDWLAKKIAHEVARKGFRNIIDIGCNDFALSKPLMRKGSRVLGVDLNDCEEHANKLGVEFLHIDFLESTRDDYPFKPDLIVMNPPFARHGNELMPHLFIKKAFELWGTTANLICLAGSWYMSNSSKRMADIQGGEGFGRLTKQITLHKTTFEPLSVESVCLFWNIGTKKPIELWSKPAAKPKQATRTISLSQAQKAYLDKKHKKGFANYVRGLIAENDPNFPQ